jgi:dTDP-4-amino-4,6-dideoxygalactose transaminase|tara:strand:+ start:3783 stop:4454 length:672 start_codon:yes stop_codon:yes gene_type:complete
MYETLDKIIPILEKEGYKIEDPWDVVDAFEDKVAKYAGSKYAVSCDSCTNAMFMCLKYLGATETIILPKKTYLSVPGLVAHAGCKIKFKDFEWSGVYPLDPYPVIDGATRFTKDMYIKGTYHCLSFHIRKVLAIAKGGMILTDDKEAAEWFKRARYEGRNNREAHDSIDDIDILGWNYYMPPEQAAKGVEVFNKLPEFNKDTGGSWKYKDLSHYSAWKNYISK